MDSKIDIQNTKFHGDLSSGLVYTSEDIYSDGTCTDSFWYSAHECESNCNSCEVSKYYMYFWIINSFCSHLFVELHQL